MSIFKILTFELLFIYSFIDVLTPVLSQLHPLTIVNQLHIKCSQDVQKHNELKKEKLLHLSQLRAQIVEKNHKKASNNGGKCPKGSSENLGNSFEETRACHTRTLLKVSKVSLVQEHFLFEIS